MNFIFWENQFDYRLGFRRRHYRTNFVKVDPFEAGIRFNKRNDCKYAETSAELHTKQGNSKIPTFAPSSGVSSHSAHCMDSSTSEAIVHLPKKRLT